MSCLILIHFFFTRHNKQTLLMINIIFFTFFHEIQKGEWMKRDFNNHLSSYRTIVSPSNTFLSQESLKTVIRDTDIAFLLSVKIIIIITIFFLSHTRNSVQYIHNRVQNTRKMQFFTVSVTQHTLQWKSKITLIFISRRD